MTGGGWAYSQMPATRGSEEAGGHSEEERGLQRARCSPPAPAVETPSHFLRIHGTGGGRAGCLEAGP